MRDLSGTAVDFVRVDIGAGDLRSDTVAVEGTAGPDKIRVLAGFDSHELIGLATRLFVVGAEQGDRLRIDGRDGDDTIDASAMAKDKFQPFLTGGAGKDVLVGSPGQDVVTGGPGVDVGLLRDGLDTFTWQVGDGNDIVEGGAGTDFLQMAGSDAAERFAVESLGGRTRLLRESDVVDLGDVERLDVLAGRGADTMEVNDLSGTDTDVVTWELAPTRGTTATDQAADSVTVDGTFGNDAISVAAAGQEVRVSGLAASVVLLRADPGLDRLAVDTKAGRGSDVRVPDRAPAAGLQRDLMREYVLRTGGTHLPRPRGAVLSAAGDGPLARKPAAGDEVAGVGNRRSPDRAQAQPLGRAETSGRRRADPAG